ncbi:MAG TPA: transporter associated domain-containing protein [Thermoanaerobaculia bacterium]|nr:transporter associated domain-containing protein [Thermoanaerobaculia bacterium]
MQRGRSISHLGERMPKVADRIEVAGFRFQIVNMDGRRIDKILVAKLTP